MAKLIQLVGASGTGKSTVHKKLNQSLTAEGYNVEAMIEPGPLREFAKNYRLREDKNVWTEAAIFTADRMILYCERVFPKMGEENLVFLSSRGLFDMVVYQGLLGGVDLEAIKKMNAPIPWPDLTLAFTVDGEVGYQRLLERNRQTREPISKNETPERIDLLSSHYRTLPDYFPDTNIQVVDTTQLNQEETFQLSYKRINSVL